MSQTSNQVKTVLLLGFMTALLLFAGYALGGRNGLLIGLIFSIVMNFSSYWFSDKIVLAMYRAKPISQKDNPEIYNLVKETTHLSNLPMPKLFLIPSMQPNAFATGRDPKHSAVALTKGIIEILTKDELKGVIAHELSHIKNKDTLIQAIASTIAGVISYLAMIARWGAIFGGFGKDNDSNIFELLALAIITPLLAMIIQLAISRSREYLADQTAASFTHNPLALASALEKIDKAAKLVPMRFGNASTSSLFIQNPFSSRSILGLLSTHPPIDERIKRLRDMS